MGLEKAFQRTWPYCRNGHHFTVQHLRFSVEESAGPALLETVSGGLLWSVKPLKKKKEKKKKNVKSIVSHISAHFITSAGAHCISSSQYLQHTNGSSGAWTDIKACMVTCKWMAPAHYLVKWRLDSCTSISLLLKSLSSFLIAACRGQNKKRIWEKLQRLSTQTAASKPWLYLLLACFMHHLGLSWGHEWFCWILFSHHKSP